MAGKITFWVTLAAASVIANAGIPDGQQPQPILVATNCSISGLWPEVVYFPDDEGNLHPAIMYDEAYYEAVDPKDVLFVLYTRGGPPAGEYLATGNEDLLKRSHFNPVHPTVFVTHGLKSSAMGGSVKDIKDAYMDHHDVNVVTVDWSKTAKGDYLTVKQQTPDVGRIVAEFLQFLRIMKYVQLGYAHLIGHSLGAHVMGLAAKAFKKEAIKVGRVTGLDPAGPCFFMFDPSLRLDRDDADFVDVIHTCISILGIKPSIGQVDFFPNGGDTPQPGCKPDIGGTCSHSRAWEYYAESINSNNFLSLPCPSYNDFKHNKNCNTQERAPMGYPTPRWATGNYYLDTAKSPPYALG